MPRLKYFNNDTQEWDYVIVGGQGPQGETGPGVPVGGTDGQILAKIDGTDFNTEWIDNYTEQVKHTVKAGEALTKGQAVYVSSANGTNMIVSRANNTTEATSSKVMGVIAQDLATNDMGFVIAEGLLSGVDTHTASAGDPIWLGDNGVLIFGLANKPVAPAHLVFLGIVTRAQNNGEIWVKVQNGFELDELHDVSISSPAAGELVVRNSANTLWENATLAEAGVSAVGHTHDDRYYTETEADTLLSGKSDTSHTHDGRYYTETETDSLLSNKANLSGAAFSSGISASSIGLGGITTPTQSLELSGRAKIRSNGSESAGIWITGAAGTESSFIGASGTASTDPVGVFHNGAWRLQVDNSGRISQPYQPAFRAYYPSAAAGAATISFSGNDAGFSGRNSGWNGSNRFTAPIAGVYVFSFAILINPSVARINFRINGTASTTYGETLIDGYNSYASPSMSMAFKLNANDYVELYNEQASVYGTSYGSFSGFFIG